MNNKLFVGALSFDTTESSLANFFSKAGTVTSTKIMMDKMTGRPRGFAFVEMSSEEEAQKAIAMLHEQTLDGRKIAVNIARPMEERGPRQDTRKSW